MRDTGNKYRFSQYLLIVVVLFAGYFLRIHELFTMPRGIHNDEATNIIWAWRWSAGYGMPYFFDSRPEPFDAMIRSAWAWFVGLTPFTHRVFHILLSMIGIAAGVAASKTIYRDHSQKYVVAITTAMVLAIIPANVIINRSIYRANWVVPMALLAITFTIHAQRTSSTRHTIIAGVFTGLTALFYLSGLVFIPALILAIFISILVGSHVIKRRNIAIFLCALGLTMLPWFVLYATIPNWLDGRVDALEPINPLETPLEALQAYGESLLPIIRVDTEETENIRYNTYTASFLNPALFVVTAIGFAASLWSWRKNHRLTPIIVGIFFVLPSALSGNTQVVIRSIGLFVSLALLAGYGTSIVVFVLAKYVKIGKQIGYIAVFLLLSGSVLNTNWHIQYHYKHNPVLHENPRQRHSVAAQYHLGYYDFAQYVIHNDIPMYVPAGFLNENATAFLRPVEYPTVRGYDGRELPVGEIVMPEQHISDFPPIGFHADYVLFLPDTREIMLLPPLEREASVELFNHVEEVGEALMSRGGWRIGFRLPVSQPDMIFPIENFPDGTQTLATFDDNLELLSIVAPHDLIRGGQVNHITTYWRLREPTRMEYNLIVQPYTLESEATGIGEMRINHWFFPSPMWNSNDIIPFTFWVRVYDDASPGAYRFLVGVYTKPYNEFLHAVPNLEFAKPFLDGERVIVGHSEIEVDNLFVPPPDDAEPIFARFNNQIVLEHSVAYAENLTMTFNLYWSVLETPPLDYTIFIHVQDINDNLIAQQDIQPFDGRYPTGHWTVGERYTTSHTVTLPENVQCPCEVFVGMYSNHDLRRLEVSQLGHETPGNRVPLDTFGELR